MAKSELNYSAPVVISPGVMQVENSAAVLTTASLSDQARKILERSGWQKYEQEKLSGVCRELIARLSVSCPELVVGRPYKPGEVAGEIPVNIEEFRSIFAVAAGAAGVDRVVWADGNNELLIELAKIEVKCEEGLLYVRVPVACEETGPQTVTITFATGSEANPAGLLAATDTRPEGPPEIVEIWGEHLVTLAWTSLLKALSSLADAAGVDQDRNGLIASGLSTSGNGVILMMMARHAMDRTIK